MKDTHKTALLVIYNHRYDKNIGRINEMYKDRFQYVFQLVPFYDGDEENVIAVYENSYQFQGYIAQAYQHLKNKGFTHYFIVADDMVINPDINEYNIWEMMGIEKEDAFITRIKKSSEFHKWAPHGVKALYYNPKCLGVEISNILPTKEEADRKFERRGIYSSKFHYKLYTTKYFYKDLLNHLKSYYSSLYLFLTGGNSKKGYKAKGFCQLEYPLIGGYSDILLIPQTVMPQFCTYCGAFAASRLFVEMAIPTSLYLCDVNIKTKNDIKLKCGDLWTEEDKAILEKYEYSLSRLLTEYDRDYLFFHPVKLSKWK